MTIAKKRSSTQTPKKSISTAKRRQKRVKTAYSQEELNEIFRRFSIQRPEPKGELEHTNPFTLVVAVALSAQATDVGVNRATRALFEIADTPQKMLALGEDEAAEVMKYLGPREVQKLGAAMSTMRSVGSEQLEAVLAQFREVLDEIAHLVGVDAVNA